MPPDIDIKLIFLSVSHSTRAVVESHHSIAIRMKSRCRCDAIHAKGDYYIIILHVMMRTDSISSFSYVYHSNAMIFQRDIEQVFCYDDDDDTYIVKIVMRILDYLLNI
jgi:hypothetical protein